MEWAPLYAVPAGRGEKNAHDVRSCHERGIHVNGH